MPHRKLRAFESDNGLVALAQGVDDRFGRYWEPLECMWQFSTPFAIADYDLIDEFYDCAEQFKDDWDLLVLTGLTGGLLRRVVRSFEGRFHVLLLSKTLRVSAYIGDGLEGFLARRSAQFRRGLKRSLRRCEQNDVEFEVLSGEELRANWEKHYDRAVKIEFKSHKGLDESGIDQPGMQEFYRLMIPRLVKRGAFRLIFALHQGKDVGFVFGGNRGVIFRGLQMSFVESYRPYALGNVLQSKMIHLLAQEGIQTYDLGSDIDYKRRWAENEFLTVSLGVVQG